MTSKVSFCVVWGLFKSKNRGHGVYNGVSMSVNEIECKVMEI